MPDLFERFLEAAIARLLLASWLARRRLLGPVVRCTLFGLFVTDAAGLGLLVGWPAGGRPAGGRIVVGIVLFAVFALTIDAVWVFVGALRSGGGRRFDDRRLAVRHR